MTIKELESIYLLGYIVFISHCDYLDICKESSTNAGGNDNSLHCYFKSRCVQISKPSNNCITTLILGTRKRAQIN